MWHHRPVRSGKDTGGAVRRRTLPRQPDLVRQNGPKWTDSEPVRRAGDRAVSRWARDNSAVLRSLAGQIGELDPSVHQALAEDDAAALLNPLAGAHDHLRATHPELAERIGAIGEHTDRVRRDTQIQRAERPGKQLSS